MEISYLIAAVMTAWVTLTLLGNERQSRLTEMQRAAEKAAKTSAKPATDNTLIEVS